MTVIKKLWGWFNQGDYRWLCLLLIIILALHLSVILRPAELVLDEQHYVKDARHILQGDGTLIPEHPPLGKLFIVSGIFLFGDNPFGWRFFSVLFGLFCILLFYLICRRLAMPKSSSLMATFLLAVDNLSFVQAGVAMLDVYMLALTLLSFWLYLRGRYILSGVAVGLSALVKLSGALALVVILIYSLVKARTYYRQAAICLVASAVSFILLMPFLDWLVMGKLLSPLDRLENILSLTGSLTFASTSHEAASRPWDWVIKPLMMAYWYTPHYTAAISFTIWALIIPGVVYMVYLAIRGSRPGLWGISWFTGTYLLWIPASLITDRISFVYYFYPAIGAVCVGLGLGLYRLLEVCKEEGKRNLKRLSLPLVLTYLALHLVVFVILSPVFS